MFRRLLICLLLLSLPVLAQTSLEKIFDSANAAMETERYEEALEGYRKVLAVEPESSGALWNGGLSAYFLGQGEEAKKHWLALLELEPDNFALRAKLIQAYQMLGDTAARDAARDELRASWQKARTDQPEGEFAKQKSFCRDQFMANGHRVFVYEPFVIEDPRIVWYAFVSPEDPKFEDFWISLGSYKFTTDFMRESGEVGPNDLAYHLDGYRKGGTHYTFDISNKKPAYEDVKAQAIAVFEGKANPLSSSSRGTDGDVKINLPASDEPTEQK